MGQKGDSTRTGKGERESAKCNEMSCTVSEGQENSEWEAKKPVQIMLSVDWLFVHEAYVDEGYS